MFSSLNLEENLGNIKDCWVFGYGSILWHPGFSYESRHIGYVEGYARRFWQGSVTHRGTPKLPGRVATLVQSDGDRVWGAAFHLVGTTMVEACLQHLGVRECHLGGYEVISVDFVPAENGSQSTDENCEVATSECSRKAWAFVATPGNDYFLGPAKVDELAVQVVNASGTSGPNADYVTFLADYIKANIPQDKDQHLFELDSKIRQLLIANSHPTSTAVETNETCRQNCVTMTSSQPTSPSPLYDFTDDATLSYGDNEDRHREVAVPRRRESLKFGSQGCEAKVTSATERLAMNSATVVSVRAC